MSQIPLQADVVIAGAGPGGLMLGALLAKEGRQVCLLEAGGELGGRSATVKQDGFTFEIGPHAAMDNRLRGVYEELGLTFERGGQNVGWSLHWDGGWRRFQDFYMDERDVHDRVVEAMQELSYEDLHRLDSISAMAWVDQFRPSRALRFAYEDLAVNEMVLVRGDECSAGDWIYIHKAALEAEGRFGWADYPVGGYSAMLQPLADYILANGGQIVHQARVTEVVVEDGRATGVHCQQGPQTFASELLDVQRIKAETVVWAAPVGALRGVLRPGVVPRWYAERLREVDANRTGIFGFYEGRRGSLMGPEIRTWWGERSGLPSFAISVSEYEPTTAPDGMSFTWFGLYEAPDKMRTLLQLDDLRNTFEAEAYTVMPELEGCEWRKWYASLDYQAVAQRPGFTGMFKPEVKVPEVEDLFLVGDGVRGGRGVGVENVAGSVFRAREAIVEGQTLAQLANKLYDPPPVRRAAT